MKNHGLGAARPAEQPARGAASANVSSEMGISVMTMYSIMVEAHSGWRHLVVLVFAVAILRALWGWIRGSEWGVWDQRLGMATPIVLDIQLALGVVVWIMGQHWNGFNALAVWEHPVTMIIAIAVAHVTWVQVKKKPDSAAKFRTETIGYAIAAAVLALGILRITHVI
jgi:hypothetical protein